MISSYNSYFGEGETRETKAESGRANASQLLERIAAQNPDTEVQASALFARSEMFIGTRGSDATDEQRQEALTLLAKVVDLTEDARLEDRAEKAIEEEKILGVGKVAPDIEGADLDGVEFKLSDYRGKVVMLDFWGDW